MKRKLLFSLLALSLILNGFVASPVLADSLPRIFGQNRYETAVAISQATFQEADAVILANGETYVDALPASTLANILKAPILLTDAGSVPSSTMAEINRLKPKQIYLMGGEAAISNGVATSLQQLSYPVERIGGTNRSHTSELICQKIQTLKTINAIALTTSVADAVASGSYRGDSIPLILIDPTSPSNFAEQLVVAKKIVLGGEAIFSKTLADFYHATDRIGGANRYDTSVLLAKAMASSSGHVILVNGITFIDALTVATYAFQKNAVMLLTEKESIGTEVRTYLKENPYTQITLIGGENAISSYVLDEKPVVDPSKPMIALTFDGGPAISGGTASILNTLKAYNARATFFVVGMYINEGSALLQREFAEGHQIGNHSYDHPDFRYISESEMLWQLDQTEDLIEKYTGIRTTIMRLPFGSYDDYVLDAVPYPSIYWSIDTLDWEHQNANTTIDEVLSRAKDGDIVLMHDTMTSTATAVKTIIPELLDRGFQLVTVSEMFKAKGLPLLPYILYENAY